MRALNVTPNAWVQHALIRALGHPSASLTRSVAQTLGAIGDESATEPLETFQAAKMNEPFALANEAARAIGRIRERLAAGPSAAVPTNARIDAAPTESQFVEIDRWIVQLGSISTGDVESACAALVRLGEPALRRVLQATEGTVSIPWGENPRDAGERRSMVLGRLGRDRPDELLNLVREKTFLRLATILGLGQTGDERLKAIALQALKVYGNDM